MHFSPVLLKSTAVLGSRVLGVGFDKHQFISYLLLTKEVSCVVLFLKANTFCFI